MKVGIFFKINSDFIVDLVDLSSGNRYGDAVEYGEHYNFHEKFTPATRNEYLFKHHAYDYYPRGRVVYFESKNGVVLYVDHCLSSDDIDFLICTFDLRNRHVTIMYDNHYVCAQCNPQYVE